MMLTTLYVTGNKPCTDDTVFELFNETNKKD